MSYPELGPKFLSRLRRLLATAPARGRVVDACCATYVIVIAVIRYRMLVQPFSPSGVDGGNWLALGHSIFGDDVRSTSIVYPPLVPILVTAASGLFGTVTGISVTAAVASLGPAVGMYVVLRSAGMRWRGAVLAGFLAPASSTGEPTAWGGYPQLIGLGLLTPTLWLLDRYLRTGRRRDGLAAGAVLGLMFATSHLIAAVAVLASGILVVLRFTVSRHDLASSRPRTMARLALVALPSLPFLPLYLRLSRTVLATFQTRPLAERVRADSLVATVNFAFREFQPFWHFAAALALVTPIVLSHRRRTPLWVITTSLVLVAIVTLVLGRELRLIYVVPLAAILGLACLTDQLPRPAGTRGRVLGATAALALVAALAVQSLTGLSFFRTQRAFYNFVSPDLLSALEWMETGTDAHGLILVGPVRGAPLGWWVEGLSRRRALPASELQWLSFPDERARAQRANDLLSNGFPSVPDLLEARAQGVTHAFVAKEWQGLDHGLLDDLKRRSPGAVKLENSGAVIVDLRRLPPAGVMG